MRNNAVLVLGDYQQSIVVVRSLARGGHRVVVGQQGRRAFSALSRFGAETWSYPDPARTPEFAAALRRLLAQRPEITRIFPVGESDLLAMLELHEPLGNCVKVVMPPRAVVEACLDKPRTYQVAIELGVPVAPTALAAGYQDLLARVAAIGLPVVIKCPDSSRLLDGRKAVIWHGPDDGERWRGPLSAVCGTYALALLVYLARFRDVLLTGEWPLLLLALGWFAVSLGVDRLDGVVAVPALYLWEDGAKLFGIVSWLLFHGRLAAAFVAPLRRVSA